MKKSLLFLIAATTLITGISCSDDNTNFDPTGDELGIPYKEGYDIYGVGVWSSDEANYANYYSLIEEIISEKKKYKSISFHSSDTENIDVYWNCSAPIVKRRDYSTWIDYEGGKFYNFSEILINLTGESDSFTVEAIVTIDGKSVRRFQTIPINIEDIQCDAFYYTFGTYLAQMEEMIDNEEPMNTSTLKKASHVNSAYVCDYLGFTKLPVQKLEKLYCTTYEPEHQIFPERLLFACEKCQIPEEPKMELRNDTGIYYVKNPQQWEVNGLRCTLENTTWRQLGASDDTNDTEFACLTIEKL